MAALASVVTWIARSRLALAFAAQLARTGCSAVDTSSWTAACALAIAIALSAATTRSARMCGVHGSARASGKLLKLAVGALRAARRLYARTMGQLEETEPPVGSALCAAAFERLGLLVSVRAQLQLQ